MRRLAVSRAILILLVSVLILIPIAGAGSWSQPSYVTEPDIRGYVSMNEVSISGDGTKIAFVASVNNASHVFVINSDGSGLKQLTDDAEGVGVGGGSPSISGDGTKIAFTKVFSGSDPNDPHAEEIFIVNSDGSGLKQLTYKSGGDMPIDFKSPSISNDGSKIAFFHVDFNTWNRGIFVMNSDGTGEKQLTDGFHEELSISGDGSKIAFLGGDEFDFQVFVINSDGTGLTQLTHNTGNYEPTSMNPFCGPSISADGSKVAFEGYVGDDMEIFVANSDGTELKQLTDNSEDDWAPRISGDGSRIAFSRSPFVGIESYDMEIKSQIFVINSDGTGLTQLTNDSERVFMFPCIDNNGEKIAFWNALWVCDPESEVSESEVGISAVSYLSGVEEENGNDDVDEKNDTDGYVSTLLVIASAAVVGGLGITLVVYRRRYHSTWEM